MKLNEIMNRKCWVVVDTPMSSGRSKDMNIVGVFSKSSEAERYISLTWCDYISEDLNESEVEELNKIINDKNFSIENVYNFANKLKTMVVPSFDQMMEDFTVFETFVDPKF